MTTAPTTSSSSFTFALDETATGDKKNELILLHNTQPPDRAAVRLRIDRIGLSANNKFYVGFGRNSTFQFFSAYPVANELSSATTTAQSLVHPPAWGMCTVTESAVAEIPVGDALSSHGTAR